MQRQNLGPRRGGRCIEYPTFNVEIQNEKAWDPKRVLLTFKNKQRQPVAQSLGDHPPSFQEQLSSQYRKSQELCIPD